MKCDFASTIADQTSFSRTFTMTIILMISTIIPVLHGLLPIDVEEVIETGKRNLLRFSQSVTQFEWHIQVLENLDRARRARIARRGI